MITSLKCRTFPKDTITFDYGINHVLVTAKYESGKEIAICLNDSDIAKLIEYLKITQEVSE